MFAARQVGTNLLAGALPTSLLVNSSTLHSLHHRLRRCPQREVGAYFVLPHIRSYYHDERDAVGTTASY